MDANQEKVNEVSNELAEAVANIARASVSVDWALKSEILDKFTRFELDQVKIKLQEAMMWLYQAECRVEKMNPSEPPM